MRESNYCMFFMEANRSKVFEIIDRRTFYIFPAVFMFCKVNILLFLSLLKMITASVGRWIGVRWVGGSMGKWSVVGWSVVSGSVVGGSVVDGFNKTQFIFVPPIINIRASILPCPLIHWNITFSLRFSKT